jgi:hypothetical protein
MAGALPRPFPDADCRNEYEFAMHSERSVLAADSTNSLSFGIATEAKTGQTNVQFNNSSTGGTIESFPDAEDQAKEAKSQEGRCEGNQAGAEAEAAERKDGQCRCSEREILAVVTIGGRAESASRIPPAGLQ